MRADDQRVSEVLDVIAAEAGIDRALLAPDVPVSELGISSLDLIETIFTLESRFGIEVPNEGPLNNNGVTVGALVDEVIALLDKKAAAAGASS